MKEREIKQIKEKEEEKIDIVESEETLLKQKTKI